MAIAHSLLIGALLVAMLGGAVPARAGGVAARPLLTLSPNQAPCGTALAARGGGFPAGRAVEIAVADPRTKPTGTPPALAVADATGAFALPLVPCDGADPAADGTAFVVTASVPNPDPLAPPDAYARAAYTVGPRSQRPTPTLRVTPESGACNGPALASGAGWSPGDTLSLVAASGDQAVAFGTIVVGADGTFALPFELRRATNCAAGAVPRLGTQFRIGAGSDPRRGSARGDAAGATYTVTRERRTERCFAETGHCVRGTFFDRWEWLGLAAYGYPLGEEFDQTLDDGQFHRVQYFERARLERHPGNAAPYDILLGQFGRQIVAGVPGAPTAPAPPQAGAAHFPETGHNVGPRFGDYWEAHGGLAQFGLPLTEAFAERLEDGQTYTVQYFERARFEHHPENAAPHDVLLGQFGRRILGGGAARSIAIDPPVGPCPATGVVAVRGRGFTPGAVARFAIRRERDGELGGGNSPSGGKPANADGSYANPIPLLGCGADEPPGSTFTITVAEYTPQAAPANGSGASAVFTVTAP